jgi:hypothetical protein
LVISRPSFRKVKKPKPKSAQAATYRVLLPYESGSCRSKSNVSMNLTVVPLGNWGMFDSVSSASQAMKKVSPG